MQENEAKILKLALRKAVVDALIVEGLKPPFAKNKIAKEMNRWIWLAKKELAEQ